MKKYTFSMIKVLNWRTSQEEVAKKNFLQQKQELNKQEEILKNIKMASEDLKVSMANLGNINKMRQQHLYKNYLAEQIVQQTTQVEIARKLTEKELANFIEAQKERKILEKLEARQYEEYLAELKLFEQKELDEMGNQRYSFAKN